MVHPLILIALGSEIIGVGSAITLVVYDRHLRNGIKRLEPEYERLYKEKPRGPLNDTFGAMQDYRTFLKYAVEQKL